jgi:hypothetical protein
MQIDSAGNEEWSQHYGGDGSEAAYAIYQTQAGNLILAGHTSSMGSGSYDAWLIKLDLETAIRKTYSKNQPGLYVYPNPGKSNINICFGIKSETNVTIYIVNIYGEIIKELCDSTMQHGEYSIRWDGKDSGGKNVPVGIYYCLLNSGNYKLTEKIIIHH